MTEKLLNAAIVLLIFMVFAELAHADIAVVVNASRGVESLSEKQVRDLFMGRFSSFPDGSAAVPVDQPFDSDVRAAFYKGLTGKSVSQINAYWAKLIFSGRSSPPRVSSSADMVVDIVSSNHSIISYVPEDAVTDDMTVVFLLHTYP